MAWRHPEPLVLGGVSDDLLTPLSPQSDEPSSRRKRQLLYLGRISEAPHTGR
jgi:hypothetical protein